MLSRNAPWLMKKNYLERTRLISYRLAVISTKLSVFYQIVQKLIRPCNFSDNSNQPDFRVFYKPSFLKCTRTTVNYISRNQHLAENRVLNGQIVKKQLHYPNGYNFFGLNVRFSCLGDKYTSTVMTKKVHNGAISEFCCYLDFT